MMKQIGLILIGLILLSCSKEPDTPDSDWSKFYCHLMYGNSCDSLPWSRDSVNITKICDDFFPGLIFPLEGAILDNGCSNGSNGIT